MICSIRMIHLSVPRIRPVCTSLHSQQTNIYLNTISRQPLIPQDFTLYYHILKHRPFIPIGLSHLPRSRPDIKMEVDLKKFEDHELLQDFDRPIYNMLKATLQYPADPKSIGAKLAGDITFMCRTPMLDGSPADTCSMWTVIIQLSRYIPPDHPWQDSLVQAVDNLRQQEGPISDQYKYALWKNLPELALCMREEWNEIPTEINEEGFSKEQMEELMEDFVRWKNQNSFAARLTGPSFAPWLTLPIWQLREALETPPAKGARQECRVWVACEWILRCAEIIFEDMNSDEEPNNAFQTGSLCGEDIPQFSIKRWEFWKKRLGEIAADAESLKLEGPILERISDTVMRMETVQKEMTKN
ncbi:uncharacterized protein F4807DRAFT_409338 [Annulohypoxylon truncatum]|uniref:uncharacterized protein n=1 Tax=Annulohypoxylon truncatum TaxID=327061 RepID=UPI002007FCC9|nr:uncharacterized protein F4807DRAFT_409338 [Annulohypoxylon truncatum]KAI1213843.1 hypothetical protein F4807DRAFT_409338 [Annulohypoxylon truncatum]